MTSMSSVDMNCSCIFISIQNWSTAVRIQASNDPQITTEKSWFKYLKAEKSIFKSTWIFFIFFSARGRWPDEAPFI